MFVAFCLDQAMALCHKQFISNKTKIKTSQISGLMTGKFVMSLIFSILFRTRNKNRPKSEPKIWARASKVGLPKISGPKPKTVGKISPRNAAAAAELAVFYEPVSAGKQGWQSGSEFGMDRLISVMKCCPPWTWCRLISCCWLLLLPEL